MPHVLSYTPIGGEHERKSPMITAELYTPSSNTWTRISPMLRARSWAAAADWQNRFYVFGYVTHMITN